MTFAEAISIQHFLDLGLIEIGDGYRAKNSELGHEGIPFARAGNVDGGFDFRAADQVPLKHIHSLGSKVSQIGDSLFTSKGTVGRVAYVTQDTPQFVYSPQLCYWRSKNKNVIDPQFLNVWMRGDEFARQIAYLKGQTDMADYVSLRDQRKMKVSFPAIREQQIIGNVVFGFDDKIELNRQINQTLEQMAQALFQSWFVDFEPVKAKLAALAEGRDPLRAAMSSLSGKTDDELDALPREQWDALAATAALFPDEMEPSARGDVPKGWTAQPLDTIANYLNGLALQKYPPESAETWLPVVKIAQLKKGDTQGADHASVNLRPEYIVDDGDVLFSWSGSLEVDIWCGGKGALNQHLFKVTSASYPKWFYYLWTKQHLSHFQATAAGKAVTMGHIQRKHLTEALCTTPPIDDLDKMGIIVANILDKTINHRIEAGMLANLRDFLLPKLLSGELAVNCLAPEASLEASA